jgi:hypothetical protein
MHVKQIASRPVRRHSVAVSWTNKPHHKHTPITPITSKCQCNATLSVLRCELSILLCVEALVEFVTATFVVSFVVASFVLLMLLQRHLGARFDIACLMLGHEMC